jgi:hypothetical protein
MVKLLGKVGRLEGEKFVVSAMKKLGVDLLKVGDGA